MDYTLNAFVSSLRDRMYNSKFFPYLKGRGSNPNGTPKHGGYMTPAYNEEIKEVAFKVNPTIDLGDDIKLFEIGNDEAEAHYPYYHILEDSPVIHKRNKGSSRSKGTQDKVRVLKDRDYGIVEKKINKNGKTFYKQEYRSKNYRGKRLFNLYEHSQHKVLDLDTGITTLSNTSSPTYMNEHYKYIEKVLDSVVKDLANEFGMELVAARNSNLEEDFNLSGDTESLLETLTNM